MATDTNAIARRDESGALAIADREQAAGALAHILGTGDLSKLTNEERVATYLDLCQSLSLNPRSRPFDWLVLDGKLVLYPNKSCGEQLRRQHQISVKVTRREIVGDLFVCEVEGRTPTGRTDEASKYVPLTAWDRQAGTMKKLTGQNLANAFAKAETGAKRRLVLSMVGLASPPDPEEIKGARFVTVDGTGRILDQPTEEQRYLAENPNAALAIGEPTFETTGQTSTAPLAGTPDQRVTTAELTHPRREGPRPTFKASDEDVRRWLGAWFAAVKGTPWEPDAARARYVTNHTATWPEAKRCSSLRTMFARCTDDEARDFLAGIRAVVNVWKEDQTTEEIVSQDEQEEPVTVESDQSIDEALEAATIRNLGRERRPIEPTVTATSSRETPASSASPERLVDGQEYPRPRLLELYAAWSERMKSLDVMWRPDDVKRLSDAQLRDAVAGLTGQVDTVETVLAMADDEPAAEAF